MCKMIRFMRELTTSDSLSVRASTQSEEVVQLPKLLLSNFSAATAMADIS